jgi:anti-sigma B factor antagonist
LDLASSPALEEALERAGRSAPGMLILDLSELEFMDSTGLSVLVRAHHRAQESGWRFGLVKGGPQVQRLLNLTGIDQRITVADSPEQLLDGS